MVEFIFNTIILGMITVDGEQLAVGSERTTEGAGPAALLHRGG
jgi:hypothetical protein